MNEFLVIFLKKENQWKITVNLQTQRWFAIEDNVLGVYVRRA